ncbi:MAG: hypothetical protein MJ010_03320 [Paludibacteraceae bacterium]|nr:hypothetical protein [Paludibacteraceae bacterium]
METPNLFNYATSELSQDAFILWLLDWANPAYEETDENLHTVAQAFVYSLLDKPKFKIESIKCIKQKYNIDVLAIINDKYALIVEDKTNTKAHDQQLQRYSTIVREKYTKCSELHCVYFKSGNESFYTLNKLELEYSKYIKDNSSEQFRIFFKEMLREDILSILKLKEHPTSNAIFVDYINNLCKLQKWSDSYKDDTKTTGLWGNTAWQGFYMAIENIINSELNKNKQESETKIYCKWDSKPKGNKKNQKKKEISIWYLQLPKLSITGNNNICLYLCLELNKLSIKAYCKGECRPQAGWSNILNKLADTRVNGFNAIPVKSVSKGENVTLCNIRQNKSEFIDENSGYADIKKVTSMLLELQEQLSAISVELRQNSINEI